MNEIDLDLLRRAIEWEQGYRHWETSEQTKFYPAAILAAAKELLALKEATPSHPDYDVALPEIEEWVNRNGAW